MRSLFFSPLWLAVQAGSLLSLCNGLQRLSSLSIPASMLVLLPVLSVWLRLGRMPISELRVERMLYMLISLCLGRISPLHLG